MRTTLTILLLGLVVLPMTCVSSLSAKSLEEEKSPVWSHEESNLSDNPMDFINVESSSDLMDFTITASSATVAKNESFCVQVSVDNFTDILGIEFLVTYDPSQLQFSEVNNLNLAGLTQSSFGKPGVGSNPAGQMKVSWFDQTVSGVSVANGTVIFDVCFTALSVDASGTVDFANPEIIDINENILPFTGVAGAITVGAGGNSGGNTGGNTGSGSTGDFTLTISDEGVQQGQQVCVDVSVTNFTDILGVEAVFNYDPAKLRYDGVQNLNLAGLNQSGFGEPGVGANPLGQLKLSWFDQTVSGVDVADATAIFQICFTALVNDASDNVFVSNDEIIDINENILAFVGETGTITIGSGGNTGGGGGSSTDFTLTVGDATATQGQEVCVPVSVANFSDILGVELVFNYDPAKLQYTGVQSFNLDGLNQSGFGEPGVGANPNGQLKLSWFDQTVSGVTVADDTQIFEICFTSLSNTGSTDVTLSNDEIIDINENILPFNGVAGTITQGMSTGGNTDVELIVADATVDPNDNFCVGVSANNFTSMSGMEFTLTYDPALLGFTEVRNINLTDLSQASFGLPGVGGNQPGNVKLSWFDMSGSGVSVADGTTLFEVCFDANGLNTSTDIDFTGLEIIDNNSTIAPSTGTAGTVTINQGTVITSDFTLSVESSSVDAGDMVCIPLEVDNFDNILGMEFNIEYDPAVLRFTEVKDFNLQDLSASSFGLPGVGANQEGAIKLSWFDQAASGVSVADGTAIFVMCFEVIGSGTTNVGVASNGLEIIDSNEDPVAATRVPGTITIDGLPATTDLQFIFGSTSAAPDAEVCVPVTVNNFEDVLGMEFVMAYDPAVLEYKEISNLNLDQLSLSSFGVPGVGVNPPGEIKISWFDQQVQGVTVADGTTIFELCFTVLGQSGSTQVGITEDRPIEIIDFNENAIPYQLASGTVTITSAPPLVLDGPAVITAVECNGDNTGAIDIGITGGSGQYTFAWSNGATTEDITGVAAGTYGVTVSDNSTGQMFSDMFSITEPSAAVSIDNIVQTNVLCTGESTGSIQLSASGGTGSLSYSWTGGLPNSATQSNLAAGTYNVTVTDVNQCSTNMAIVITEPASALSLQATVTPEDCMNQDNGSIVLNVSGGEGTYTYTWGAGLSGDVNTQMNLSTGDYPVTITDANACTLDTVIQVGSNPTVMIGNTVTTYIENGNDGAVTIDVSGGQGPYTYQWSGPNNFTASTEDLSGLSAAGEYCLRITDAAGCMVERCFMVLEQLAFAEVTLVNTCPDEANGMINLTISGGQMPYTYLWSNNATTEDISGLEAGNYSLTVTDNLGNTFNGQFPVGTFTPMFVVPQITSVTGDENNTNGAIQLSITGGNPAYTYNWDNGATTSSISNLSAGQYCVTVTDQNGCTAEACYTVDVVVLPLAFSANSTEVVCNGESTGTASVQISGGSSPYAISFGDNVTLSSSDGVVNRDNLPAGNLTFIITDANNTTIQGSVMITEAAPIAIQTTTITHDADAPGCTGAISIELTGGNPGYSVQWNSPNTGTDIIGLCEGNYVPTVRDASGCTVTLDPIFVNTFFLDKEVMNVECREDQNGSVSISASGGSGEYTYSWANEQGEVISDQAMVDGLVAGDYTVTVTETSGNMIVETLTVGTNSMLTASVAVESDFRGFGASCQESTDAIISVSAADGNGSLMYTWLDSDRNLVGDGDRLENVGPGDYTIEVMDQVGCTVTNEVFISAPPAIEVNAFVSNLSCVGRRDGSITAIATGGTGALSYNWSNQGSTPNINALIQGQYRLTITDANACESVQTYMVEEPAPIQVSIETTPADDGCNGIASATVNGGTAPYTFRWNSNAANTDSVLTGLCPGDYMVAVVDANGCEASPEVVEAEVLDRRFPCMEMRTVISPNGDGENEEFYINCIELTNDNRLLIFNQWGQLVFEAENYDNNWSATTSNGEKLPDGAYYYIFEFTDNEGSFIQNKGSITVISKE